MSDHWNEFRGAAKRIDDIDLPRIGAEIGVGEDELHAFADTESAGTGFDNLGRPKMLFEPHVFYRNLKGAERDRAVKQGLAYREQGQEPYPKDSYPRLVAAMEINEAAALKSASWGLFQILGENHVMVGFPTVQDMVRAFMQDEEAHLAAAVRFLVAAKIDDDLRELAKLKRPTTPEDCIPIVRVYNGSGFRRNDYHTKFAKAHNKWRGIPDTPFTVPTPTVVVPDPALILKAQQRLYDLGYIEVGNRDGKNGPRTKAAISSFQGDNNLVLTGELSPQTLNKLMDVRTPKRPVSPERATATKETIADAPVVKTASWLQKLGTGVLASAGLGAVADGTVNLDQLSSAITKAKGISELVLSLSPWVIGAVVGGVIIYFGSRLIRQQVEAYRAGHSVK